MGTLQSNLNQRSYRKLTELVWLPSIRRSYPTQFPVATRLEPALPGSYSTAIAAKRSNDLQPHKERGGRPMVARLKTPMLD